MYDLTENDIIVGVHVAPEVDIYEARRFLQDLREKRHGRWLSDKVGLTQLNLSSTILVLYNYGYLVSYLSKFRLVTGNL